MKMIELEIAKSICETSAKEAWEKAKIFFKYKDPSKLSKLEQMPPIIWKKFGFRTAGRYYLPQWTPSGYKFGEKIEMNINFLNSESAKEFVKNTIIHELAHCVAYRCFNVSGHNYVWKHIAVIMGDNGERCHSYAPPKNSNRVELTCKCGTKFSMSHLKIKRAKEGNYLCSKCKINLKELF